MTAPAPVPAPAPAPAPTAELLRHKQIEAARSAIVKCPAFADFTSPPSMCALDMATAAVDAAEAVRQAESVERAEPVADQIIGQIEERFPNWRSFRDLIDCIDVTLHRLRSDYVAVERAEVTVVNGAMECAENIRALVVPSAEGK